MDVADAMNVQGQAGTKFAYIYAFFSGPAVVFTVEEYLISVNIWYIFFFCQLTLNTIQFRTF
jgi:hypothetical protein